VQIVGIYSNLAYTRESRTLSGAEIFIVRGAGESYVALVQEANGEPGDPVLAPVVQNGGEVSIRVHHEDYTVRYDGTIGDAGFNGVMTVDTADGKKASRSFDLKRKKSYWEGP
jgi:hypothetical protein